MVEFLDASMARAGAETISYVNNLSMAITGQELSELLWSTGKRIVRLRHHYFPADPADVMGDNLVRYHWRYIGALAICALRRVMWEAGT